MDVTLELDPETGRYVVTDAEFWLVSSGETKEAAIEDYFRTLGKYFRLVEKRARTRPEYRPLLEELREYVGKSE